MWYVVNTYREKKILNNNHDMFISIEENRRKIIYKNGFKMNKQTKRQNDCEKETNAWLFLSMWEINDNDNSSNKQKENNNNNNKVE